MTIHSNQSSIQTANHILLYFFRYGNKENIEVSLRKFRIKRAKKIHNSTISSTINKEENIQLRQQLKANKLFNTFSHTVIPFLTLKTKNIQKKLEDAKIFPLTPWQSECQSIKDLSMFLKKTKKTSQPFINRLEHVLEALMISPRKSASSTISVTSNITLREKRDIIHRKAFENIPSIWKN